MARATPIRSSYYVKEADFVACHNQHFINEFNVVDELKPGGILLLESLGGGVYQMVTALEQYRQMGMLNRISGILLGTFTKMREEKLTPAIEELVLDMTPPHVAVAVTPYVGHYPDARPVWLGKEQRFSR